MLTIRIDDIRDAMRDAAETDQPQREAGDAPTVAEIDAAITQHAVETALAD